MLGIRRVLDRLQVWAPRERDILLEYAVIVCLIMLVVVLAFLLLGDTISDLVAQIGGTVDEATRSH